MTSWEQALVIILAITLSLFLLVAIIATIKIIQILNHMKRLAARAEAVVERAEDVTVFFRNVAAPTALIKMLANIFDSLRNAKTGKKERRL